jgi:phosphoribosyl 1,2-cyclic phosphate phosphodiesterase
MRLTLLGTGNAAGIPVYGCGCDLCLKAAGNALMQRTSCSALLQLGDSRYLLDAGQVNLAGRFPAGSLDAILLTHFHPDHVQGLFQLRWGTGLRIPVYCPPDSQGCADLYKHPGILQFQPLQKFVPIMLSDLSVTPLPLIHSKPTFGYLFEHAGRRIAYLTDTKGLPPDTEALLAALPLDLMVIDSSFVPGNERQGHNTLYDALSIHRALTPRQTVLTHIGHDMDIWLRENASTLPDSVEVGHDGQQVFADD